MSERVTGQEQRGSERGRSDRAVGRSGGGAETGVAEDRQWVNAESTVLVWLWSNGTMEVATRPDSDVIWGPPIRVEEQR